MDDEATLAQRVVEGWQPPSTLSTAIFVAIVLTVVALFVLGVRRSAPTAKRGVHTLFAALGVASFMAITGGMAATGFLTREDLPVPAAMIFFGFSNVTALAVALSPVGRRVALAIPAALLIAPQALRLPLELVLHQWYASGTIPVQMTFEGHNFDIVTGLAAFVVALWARFGTPPRAALLAVNTLGLGLLLAVMVIAVRSTPGPLHAYPGAPLLLAFHVPYVWIVPMCVSAALFGHVVAYRALLARRARVSGVPSRGVEAA